MKPTSQTQLVSQKENKAWPSQSADPKDPTVTTNKGFYICIKYISVTTFNTFSLFLIITHNLCRWFDWMVVPDIWSEFYVTAPLETLVMCSVLILPTECVCVCVLHRFHFLQV